MDYRIEDNGLVFEITDEEKPELARIMDEWNFKSRDDCALFWLMDSVSSMLGNGWAILNPEEIGALTEAPIIGQNVEYDEDGKVIDVDRIWWFPAYETVGFGDVLVEKGKVVFPEANVTAEPSAPRANKP